MSWIDNYIKQDIENNPEMEQYYMQEGKNLDFIMAVCKTVDMYRKEEYLDEYFIKDVLDLAEDYLGKGEE